MYDYNYGYVDQSETLGLLGGLAAISGLIMIISLVIGIITLVSQWKIYKKQEAEGQSSGGTGWSRECGGRFSDDAGSTRGREGT